MLGLLLCVVEGMKHLAVPSWTGFCHWHDSDRGSQYHTFQRDPNYTTTLHPQNKFRDMPYYFFCRCLLLSHALEGYLGAYLVRIVAPRFLTRAMRNRSVSLPRCPLSSDTTCSHTFYASTSTRTYQEKWKKKEGSREWAANFCFVVAGIPHPPRRALTCRVTGTSTEKEGRRSDR